MHLSLSLLFLSTFQLAADTAAVPIVEPIERRGVSYQLVRATPAQVRVLWKGDDDKQLYSFRAAAADLRAAGERPAVLMNGGIFEPLHIPSGLLVQGGKTLRPLNPREGKGNFFLKPNGVFWIAGVKAGVTDAAKFDLAMPGLREAVQSGPLLLEAGKAHPAFNRGSKSRLHRNGVGVTADGQIVFAITVFRQTEFPNLWEFADLFRSLGCTDALFLDGDLSQLRAGKDIERRSNRFASIIAVLEEPEPERDVRHSD